MVDFWRQEHWIFRGLYLGLAVVLLFTRLLPLGHEPGSLPGPDLLICLTLAWVVRRPDFLPMPLILIVMLAEDLILMRPPGLWCAIVVLATEFLRSRVALTRELNFLVEWALIAGVMLGMMLAYRLALAVALVPQPAFGFAIVQFLWSIALYPLVVGLSRLVLDLRKPAMGEVDDFGEAVVRRSARDSEETARVLSRRTLMLGGAMSAMVAALGVRMRYLQVDQADEFRLLAEENRINIRLIPPERGLIQDRNGKLIAANEQNYRVVITREAAGDVDLVLRRLAGIIPMTAEELERTIEEVKALRAFVPVTVAERLSWDDFSKVALNAPALPGVVPEVGLSRRYPLDQDFAHVVGYVGPVSEKDLEALESPDPLLRIPKFQIGKIGVEKWMEDTLRGRAGTKRIEVNSAGRVMRELERQEGDPGTDIRLTIDADVQNFAQARLGDESAAVVVMDITNGDLVCIASSPSFDPNLFVRGISHTDYNLLMENDHRPLANKTVSGAYPPGSTFKMVTALAALEAGVATPETRVRCPGYIEFGGRRFHCWKRGGHGTVDLERSLSESCDVYYYDIAQKVGIDKIAEMGRKLGLGQRFDIPMSAITEGIMPDKQWKLTRHKAEWRIGDTINASIGQGYVLTSPLQLAVMTARLASGKAVSPRLVRMVNDRELPIAPAPVLDIPPEYLGAIRRGMHEVVNGERGTAKSSRIVEPTLAMAGKTGTSQVRNISAAEREAGVISNDQLPWNRRDHALFVGFAPYDAPRYAIAVVVEHGGGGSTAAAPIARDIILRAMSDGLPSLDAYPASQRGRIESMLKELPLRDPVTGLATVRTRA